MVVRGIDNDTKRERMGNAIDWLVRAKEHSYADETKAIDFIIRDLQDMLEDDPNEGGE